MTQAHVTCDFIHVSQWNDTDVIACSTNYDSVVCQTKMKI